MSIGTHRLLVAAAATALAWTHVARAADAPGAPAAAAAIAAAIASPDRPESDREQDPRRQPQQVLEFAGVAPGMDVIDVFAAGGYYTELLARTVGVKGQVIAYNNPPYAAFAAKGIEARYAGGRLGNVRQVTATIEALELRPDSLDLALFVMSYHDLYWRPDDGSWPTTDPAQLLAKLYAALRPGAAVVIEDHVANPGGSPDQVVNALHRIDPAVVRSDFERAGFVFDGESRVLANPADDHTKAVFDDAVRGHTDRFLFRYRKPAR
ncbi:MAG: methyltransferase domain-containing protein [Steroidobacteraceae bacterium]